MDEGVIVIDAGSGSTKIGYSGEDTPRSIFPSVVDHPVLNEGTSRRPDVVDGAEDSLVHPVKRGMVTDWDQMERLWDHTFGTELRTYPETGSVNGVPVLLTEPPLNDKKSREQMARLMFETFKAPAVCICNSAVLSLFASGRTRGVVLESGSGVTSAVPIFEGFALPHATLRENLAGQDVTQHLQGTLAAQGHTELDLDIVRDIKEKLAVVRCPGTAQEQAGSSEYELPDGSMITIDSSCRSASADALLFVDGEDGAGAGGVGVAGGKGLPALVQKAISMCDRDLQPDLLSSVVLAGGTTMLPGFSERLKHELVRISPPGTSFNVVPDNKGSERGYNSQRKHAAWIGGSMFASLDTFRHVQVTKQEWEDCDESIIHRRGV